MAGYALSLDQLPPEILIRIISFGITYHEPDFEAWFSIRLVNKFFRMVYEGYFHTRYLRESTLCFVFSDYNTRRPHIERFLFQGLIPGQPPRCVYKIRENSSAHPATCNGIAEGYHDHGSRDYHGSPEILVGTFRCLPWIGR